MRGSESFLSAAFFLKTEVGMKGLEECWRGDPEVTMEEETADTDWDRAEFIGAVEEDGGSESPCLRLKFSFCSSSFLLIRAWE